MRFNERGAAGLLDGKSPGQPTRLNDVQRQAIVRMIESGPIPAASWARQGLSSKNALTFSDAQLVEAGFQA
jgi:hypothetical protein